MNCQVCQQKINQYQKISDVLANDNVELSPDFSLNVLQQINDYRRTKESLREYCFYGIFILAALIIGLIFFNYKALVLNTYHSIVNYFSRLTVLRSIDLGHFKLLNNNPIIYIVLVSMIFFIIIQIVDSKFINKNHL
jgi:hypothetical protein